MYKNKLTFIYGILLLKIILILGTEDVYAYSLGYLAEISAEYTDNIGRVREDPESEITQIISGGLVFLESSEKVDVNFDLTIRNLDYKNDLADDQTIYELASNGEWRISQDVLTIRYDDTFDRVRIDSTGSETPGNQEDVNIFSIGPELQIQLGSSNEFITEYRYLNNYYEVSDADSEGSTGAARLQHQSVPGTIYSINYFETRLNYQDSEFAQDYIERSFLLGFEKETGTSQLILGIGQSFLQSEGSEESGTTTGALRYERNATPEARWIVGYTRAYANSTNLISGGYGSTSGAYGSSIATEAGTVFIIDRVSLGIGRENISQVQLLELYGAKIDYENEGDIDDIYDRNIAGLRIGIRENFTQDMSLLVGGTYEGTNFVDIPRQDRDAAVEVRYDYEFQRNIFLRLSYTRDARESTLPSVEYLGNTYWLSLAYDSTIRVIRNLPRTGRRGRLRNR